MNGVRAGNRSSSRALPSRVINLRSCVQTSVSSAYPVSNCEKSPTLRLNLFLPIWRAMSMTPKWVRIRNAIPSSRSVTSASNSRSRLWLVRLSHSGIMDSSVSSISMMFMIPAVDVLYSRASDSRSRGSIPRAGCVGAIWNTSW